MRAQREQPILFAVRAALISTGRVLLFRNNSGADTVTDGRGVSRFIRYGLGVGSADLIGLLIPTGRGFAIECKAPQGRQSEVQKIWAAAWRRAGGFYAIARGVDEAMFALGRAERGESE